MPGHASLAGEGPQPGGVHPGESTLDWVAGLGLPLLVAPHAVSFALLPVTVLPPACVLLAALYPRPRAREAGRSGRS